MTGEVTLSGLVLPIGGLRDKVLAAQRAGIERVILPAQNAPDLDELPAQSREALEFSLVESVDEVIALALGGDGWKAPRAKKKRTMRQAPSGGDADEQDHG